MLTRGAGVPPTETDVPFREVWPPASTAPFTIERPLPNSVASDPGTRPETKLAAFTIPAAVNDGGTEGGLTTSETGMVCTGLLAPDDRIVMFAVYVPMPSP